MKKERKIDVFLHSVGGVAIVLTCIVLFNIVSSNFKQRLDLTEGNVFTLSEGTRSILQNLADDRGGDSDSAKLKIRFYRTKGNNDVPVTLSSFAQRVEDLLDQYKEIAGNNLDLEKINPSPDTDEEDLAVKDGISQINGVFYLGMSISYLDSVETVAAIDPRRERSLEYDISRRITKVLNPKKTVVGVMSSLNVWGGPDMNNPMAMMNRGQQQQPAWFFIQQLRQDYDVERVEPTTTDIGKNIDVLMVIHPKSLTEQSEYALDQFVLRGGRLLVFVDPLATRDDTGSQNPQMRIPGLGGGSNLEKLFKAWNVTFDSTQVVADLKYLLPANMTPSRKPVPSFLLLDKNAVSGESVITSEIKSLHLPFVGHFKRDNASDEIKEEKLIWSSNKSKLVDGMSSQFNGQEVIDKFGSTTGTEHIIAMRLEGKFKTAFPDGKPVSTDSDENDKDDEKEKDDSDHLSESEQENAVLLIGDTDLLVNDYSVRVQRTIFGNTAQMINGNLAFIQNAVEKMGGNSNLITIRSREDQNRPFEKIDEMQEEAQKNFQTQLKVAQETLQNIVAEKSKLEGNDNNNDGDQVLTIKINQDDLMEIRKKEADAQRKIRQIRKDLRKEIDQLEFRLQLANIGVIPFLTILTGILFFVFKKRKTAAV